jgi:hypothetical protein
MPKAKKKSSSKNGSPRVNKSAWIRSQPSSLSAKEVVEKAEAEGIALSLAQVYTARSTAKKPGAGSGRRGEGRRGPGRPKSSTNSANSSDCESSSCSSRYASARTKQLELRGLAAHAGHVQLRAVLSNSGVLTASGDPRRDPPRGHHRWEAADLGRATCALANLAAGEDDVRLWPRA